MHVQTHTHIDIHLCMLVQQLRAFFALTFFSQFFFVFGRGRVGRGRVGRGRVGRGRVHEPSIFFLSLKWGLSR